MRIFLTGGVYRNESSIVNLDNADGSDTHWVVYMKRGDRAVYFDSFNNLRPPGIVRYLDVTQIEYNRTPYQYYDQSNCRQLCLLLLQMVDNQFKNWHYTLSIQYSFHMSLTFKLTAKSSVFETAF